MDAPTEIKKRGPGRPKKVQEEVVEEPVIYEQELVAPSQVLEIKHVIRTLNWAGETVEGSQPGVLIEDYLNQNYFSQGFVLQGVYPLEIVQSIEGKAFGNTLLYILVKYAQ